MNIKNKWTSTALLMLVLNGYGVSSYAQSLGNGTISTGAPFLLIGPDAKSGGLGDAGGATAPDANSMHWNSAKYAFCDSKGGVSVNFSPWLRSVGVDDVSLSNIAGYVKIDDRNIIASSFTYFSMGQFIYTDAAGNSFGQFNPYDMAADIAYIRKFGENFSMSMAGRFIYSNLGSSSVEGVSYEPGMAFGADVGAYYQKQINPKTIIRSGLLVSNMGTKIQYGSSKLDLPTNLRLSGGVGYSINDDNVINYNFDLNQLLVPASPVYNSAGELTGTKIPNIGFGTGLEYAYKDLLFGRMGYSVDNQIDYLTFGAGVRYNDITFNMSYLLSTNDVNAMANSMRFSLIFYFGTKDMY